MNCGTCKHWGEPEDTSEFRRCLAIKHDKKGHTRDCKWDDHEQTESELKFLSENIAVACDGSGYYGALKSKSDFGCVLHESKSHS